MIISFRKKPRRSFGTYLRSNPITVPMVIGLIVSIIAFVDGAAWVGFFLAALMIFCLGASYYNWYKNG